MDENLGRYENEDINSLLKEALTKVERDYLFSENPSGNDIFIERVFAYELYHQMRVIFPDEHGLVNGEYRKYLKIVSSMKNNTLFNTRTYIPDIVVHQPSTLDKNLLAIEIKISPDLTWKDLNQDLEKLNFYTNPDISKGLGFKMGVMLIANYDIRGILPDDKKAKLKEFLEKNTSIAIWIFSFNEDKNNGRVTTIEIIRGDSDLSLG